MTKNTIVSAVVALVVSVIAGLFIGQSSQSNVSVQGLSDRDIQTATLSVGTTGSTKGTPLKFVKAGTMTCNSSFLATAAIGATSTGTYDCSVTGARSGDVVILGRSASIPGTWFHLGAYASTTANNYVRLNIYNNTGVASAGAPSTATSGIPYFLYRY